MGLGLARRGRGGGTPHHHLTPPLTPPPPAGPSGRGAARGRAAVAAGAGGEPLGPEAPLPEGYARVDLEDFAEQDLGAFDDALDMQKEVGHIVVDPAPRPAMLVDAGVGAWPVSELQEGEGFRQEMLHHRSLFVPFGKFTITPRGGHPQLVTEGAFVIVPRGLVCEWEFHEKTRMHFADHGGEGDEFE